MTKETVRWGILSTAKIGIGQVIPAMQRSAWCEITAIASRSQERATEAATQCGIPHAYGSYEALLADPSIDAIYNPLPNHLHVPWSIRALEAGKHVLCEKPIGCSAAEGRALAEAGKRFPKLKLMEAFMYRHHPQWREAKRMVDEGEIGSLRTIQTFFSYFNDDANNIRNCTEMGGGALRDIGCYAISLSRMLFAAEPTEVTGSIEYDPQFGVDRLASATLTFPSGWSTFTVSTQLQPFQRVHIFGTQGSIEIEIPFNAPIDRPCRLWVRHDSHITEKEFPICSHYTIQGDLFSRSVIEHTPVPVDIEDALRNMEVIERIEQSATR